MVETFARRDVAAHLKDASVLPVATDGPGRILVAVAWIIPIEVTAAAHVLVVAVVVIFAALVVIVAVAILANILSSAIIATAVTTRLTRVFSKRRT